MKKNVVVMLLMVVSMVFAGVSAQAQGCCGAGGGVGARQGWGSDPANDPVYKQFLEDSEEIRKEIAMDRAELDALMAGENPDKEQAKEIAARLVDNQQKLAALTRDSGFGGPGAGACGSCGGGRGYNGGCPGAAAGYRGNGGGYGYCSNCSGPGTGPGYAR